MPMMGKKKSGYEAKAMGMAKKAVAKGGKTMKMAKAKKKK
jgi:hypothetical protein